MWPLGKHVEVETLKDEVVKFKSVGDIPFRPALFLELGDPFLETGPLDTGFEVPIIGAVWQPRLWTFFINRTTVQTFDNGAPGQLRDTEKAPMGPRSALLPTMWSVLPPVTRPSGTTTAAT